MLTVDVNFIWDAEFNEKDHPRENGRFVKLGLVAPNKDAPEDFHKVHKAAESIASELEDTGLRLTRVARSGMSPSTYLTFSKPDQSPFRVSKRGRAIYAKEHGNFPAQGDFNVRVSNHTGYGGPTDVHKSIRIDNSHATNQHVIAAVKRLFELERTHPAGGI